MMPLDQKKEKLDDFRVLLIDLSRRFGGASVRALTLAGHMQPGMAAIAVLENSPVMKAAMERNIPIRIVGRYRLDPFIPFRLRKVICKDGFQIIDTQNIQSKFWGSLAALMSNVGFIATLNSAYADEYGRGFKGRLYALIDRRTNFRTDRFIAVSDSIRQGLIKSGISGAKVDLVTNAVNEDDIQATELGQIRKQMGIPEDAFVCVLVGRLVWAKGYEDFITAFACVSEQVSNSYALILGEGALRETLSNQIKSAGLESRIILLGHYPHDKAIGVLKASDIFVLPSRSEGVPFALLEAAAVGLPIIATRCGGVPEILTDNEDALLVPVGDTQAISAGILKLYQHRQLAQMLGRKAREKIRQEYSVQNQIEATRSTYRKALEHKRME